MPLLSRLLYHLQTRHLDVTLSSLTHDTLAQAYSATPTNQMLDVIHHEKECDTSTKDTKEENTDGTKNVGRMDQIENAERLILWQ